MPKIKSNKEYTIKLVHPVFGDFYYQYNNLSAGYLNNVFVFTQNLSKVKTWKSIKYIDKETNYIIENVSSGKSKIYLSFGQNVSDDIIMKLILIRKRYYYIINMISSKSHIQNAKNNIKDLNSSLLEKSKIITKSIKKCKIDDDFMLILNKLSSDIHLYRKDYKFLQKYQDAEQVILDIEDASYGFRLLKLKTLKCLSIDSPSSTL